MSILFAKSVLFAPEDLKNSTHFFIFSFTSYIVLGMFSLSKPLTFTREI